MEIREYIKEVNLETANPEIEKVFNQALEQVFSSDYLKKINDVLKRKIKLKEAQEKEGVVAFNQGGKIFVNPKEFFKLDKLAQMRYLLHEFIHILQRERRLLLSKFREIRKLSKELYELIKKYSKHPPSVFLTGKNQNLGPGGKWEVLSYFMNNSIQWDAVSPEGKGKIIATLKKYNVFNLNTSFWKRRLGDV